MDGNFLSFSSSKRQKKKGGIRVKRFLILCLTCVLLTGCRTADAPETEYQSALATSETAPAADKATLLLPEETEKPEETEPTAPEENPDEPDTNPAADTPAEDPRAENTDTPDKPQTPGTPAEDPDTPEQPAEKPAEDTPAENAGTADKPAETPDTPDAPAENTAPAVTPADKPVTVEKPANTPQFIERKDIVFPAVSSPERLGFSGGNISMGGAMAGDGAGWVYYCQKYAGTSGKGLYKARLDGTEPMKLTDDYPVKSINVLDGWVYYCGTANDSLIRVRTDGKERQVLLAEGCENLHVGESGLYCTVKQNGNPAVYYLSHDGKTASVLLEDNTLAAYWDGQIYGIDGGTVLTMYNTRTGQTQWIDSHVISSATAADATGFYFFGCEVGSPTQCFYRYTPEDGFVSLMMNQLYHNYQSGQIYCYGYNKTFSRICLYAKPCAPGLEGTEADTVVELAEFMYDKAGNWLDILWMDYRLGSVKPDKKYLASDGTYEIYNEFIQETYYIENCIYAYDAQIFDSVIRHGQLNCIAQVRDGGIFYWN